MTFLARENRQNNNNDTNNLNFGRGKTNQPDLAQIQKKQSQQQLYKLQLQRQIQQKELKKIQQQQKIRKEDQKFKKEIQQIDKKQKQRKVLEKQKQNRILEEINQSPKQKKQPSSESKITRIIPHGNLNFNIQDDIKTLPQIPKINFMTEIQPNQNYVYSNQRKRPYLYQENDQVNNYYEQRIRRHKEQMNLKLDELFHHIHSTKDHIKAEEQIDKIKRKLRSKQTPSPHQFQGESQVQLQYQNKFYNVPKPNREPYKSMNNEKSRMLDYQSSSKFSPYKNLESRAKIRTHHDQLYNLPQREQYQQKRGQKWGTKPGKDNFLANRQAIDYQAEKTLGQIEKYLEQLNKQA